MNFAVLSFEKWSIPALFGFGGRQERNKPPYYGRERKCEEVKNAAFNPPAVFFLTNAQPKAKLGSVV